MNTIQEQWISFEALVVPKNAHKIQRQEMRRAFYTGAEAMMRIEMNISSVGISEDAAVAILDGCRDEMKIFCEQVQNGKA